jgi:capsular exopolysaccharide synthesis family protein
MSVSSPSDFEQRSAGTGDPMPDMPVPASGGGTSGYAGYGGYGYGSGSGYGSSPLGDSELNLVQYLQMLYRRRYLALSVFLVTVVGTAVYTFTSPRLYLASARILIERDQPNVISFEEVLQQNSLTDDYYETQYQILQSRGLARRTIEALDLWDHPGFHTPPTRFSIGRMLMAPVDMVRGWLEPDTGVIPDPGETADQTAVIDALLAGLGIEPVRFSRLVDITFTSTDPRLAAIVTNGLAEEYIKQSVEFRSSTTKEASEFLEQQLAEQRKKLEASERALQAYRERTNSVPLQERQNIVVQKLEDLNSAVTRANTVRIQKEAAYNQIRAAQNNPAAIDSLPAVLSNQFIQQQKAELANLQRQRAQLSEKLGPNHPEMVRVNSAIETAETRIRAEIAQIVDAVRSEYEAAAAEERTLADALAQQKIEAQSLNRSGIQDGVLERDASANRQMFETLLKRTQETGVSEEIKTGNIRVVDAAQIPNGPVSPNVPNNLLLGLLSGLMLAVGIAFVLEYLDDRVKNPDELKRYLGLPFLGMVPAIFDKSTGNTPLITTNTSNMFSESFRSIRTNVLFSTAEEGGRLVVITSSVPGEGKTAVSSNISIALAQAGNRVLLIDADMRKPRVHEVFGRPLTPGLSNLLVGNATASEAIQEGAATNLWMMPAGSHPPNPAELLGSKRFRDFTAFVLQYFDWVIIDTPPVMAVTDAVIAGNLAHGVVFVVGSEMTSRRIAQRAVEQLQNGQAKFLGAVLNRVDLEHNSYYYSRYYRPDYGSYYGPGPTAGTGTGSGGSTPAAPETDRNAVAARIAAAAAKVAGLVTGSVGNRVRVERHL